ncbi:cytochrome c biogenesis protein CcdA [Haloarchaeobius salinus]|uniref:cytochrome c biogenesis protein CcdA n=1 Tax=Haloarchaeobius salinus TaxID=1198298 RepID=UPI0021098EF5|nr:cytochrome c biogenesis protein CcdA [Haloarchaeobius salinus]
MTELDLAAVVAFAASAGVATFFAPCAFPLLPGYVGYYLSESDSETSMVPVAVAAAVGALAALSAVAGLVLAVGGPVRRSLPLLEPVVGGGMVVFGLLTLTGRGPELRLSLPKRPTSVLGFGVFGAVYAVAAAGCVVPLFVGVLTQALSLPTGGAAVVLAVYALAVALPLVGVTLLAGVGVDAWRELGAYSRHVQLVAGVVMVLAGLGQVYLAVFELGVLS